MYVQQASPSFTRAVLSSSEVPVITSTVLSTSEVLLTCPALGPSYRILLEALVPLVRYMPGRFVDLSVVAFS